MKKTKKTQGEYHVSIYDLTTNKPLQDSVVGLDLLPAIEMAKTAPKGTGAYVGRVGCTRQVYTYIADTGRAFTSLFSGDPDYPIVKKHEYKGQHALT